MEASVSETNEAEARAKAARRAMLDAWCQHHEAYGAACAAVEVATSVRQPALADTRRAALPYLAASAEAFAALERERMKQGETAADLAGMHRAFYRHADALLRLLMDGLDASGEPPAECPGYLADLLGHTQRALGLRGFNVYDIPDGRVRVTIGAGEPAPPLVVDGEDLADVVRQLTGILDEADGS